MKIIAVLVILLLLVLAASVGYSYSRISVTPTGVSVQGFNWATPSTSEVLKLGLDVATGNFLGLSLDLIQSINLDVNATIANNGLTSVYIPTISESLTINGISVGPGQSDVSESVSPGQTITTLIQQQVLTSQITTLATSILTTGGDLNVQLSGQASASTLGIPVSIPFQYTTQISISQEVENYIETHILGQSSSQSQNNNIPPPAGGGATILSGEYNVSPNSYLDLPFTLSSSESVTISFSATASLGNDIIVYVVDSNGLAQYQAGQSFSAYYNSGKVSSDVATVNLGPGTYYIILDNTYSTISTKDVTITVTAS